MVSPGALSFAIIRGIAFDEVILQCRDEKVVVNGSLTPDATGLYVPCGTFSGYDLFILAGDPTFFLYYSPSVGSYVISELLTTGVLVDFFGKPSLPPIEPTGVYTANGSYAGVANVTDNPVNLTGYTPEALVRRNEKAEVILDLQPFVSNALVGEITIPAISQVDTEKLPFTGNFKWDLVLANDISLERFGPFAKGAFVISDNITQPVI